MLPKCINLRQIIFKNLCKKFVQKYIPQVGAKINKLYRNVLEFAYLS